MCVVDGNKRLFPYKSLAHHFQIDLVRVKVVELTKDDTGSLLRQICDTEGRWIRPVSVEGDPHLEERLDAMSKKHAEEELKKLTIANVDVFDGDCEF
jgi:hypothetical protein